MRIYVSSSFVDLKDYRAAVLAAIRALGHDYLAMEDYGAEDQLPVDKCLQDVAQCNLYVGIFAWRYGYVPEGYDRSITELEYRKAVEQNIPTLIFLLDEEAPWSPRLMDRGEAGDHIADLREEFKTKKLVSFFQTPDDLKAKAIAAIARQAISKGPQQPAAVRKIAPTHPKLPTGIITLVVTDIEGAAALWEQHQAAFQKVLEEHHRLLREIVTRWHGVEIKTRGEGFFLVFDKASNAVRFAVEAQQTISRHEWPSFLPELPQLRISIGLHTGEPTLGQHPDDTPDYFGPTVSRASCVGEAGHGEQIIVSDATRSLAQAELPSDITFQDLGEHLLKGAGQERLWQVCHPDLPTEFPPLKAQGASRHNLPRPATPFIGREAELREWSALLRRPDTRLVTIAGFGGMGKTRLAIELAQACAAEFADGVWWVPLDQAHTGDEMIQRIAEQLRLHLQPQPSVREQLWNFYRDRQLLLVLDNVEQIQGNEAAQVVYGLLNAGPGVKCLVTSRRRLELTAEHLVELEPLPASDAGSLFVERARARKANFAVNDGNAADIADIGRALEGVPLAIEIAASLVVLLTPRQILKRLDDQLKALVARHPDAAPRHHALRAAIDWSYDLLSADDKALFEQLSVFAGGFTLEAVEAVCNVPDVMEGVLQLRNYSLLRAQTNPDTQQERLVMLQAVREYATEKLADPDVQRRHAEYFYQWSQEYIECLKTPEEADALQALEAEFDNLRAALSWAQGQSQELCVQLALTLHQPLYLRGFWAEAQQCLQKGWQAAAALDDETKALRAALQFSMASLAQDMGDRDAANAQAAASLATYQELNDAAGAANTMNLLCLLATEVGDYEAAQERAAAALRLWPADNYAGSAKTLHNLARLAGQRGDKQEARRLYEESIAHKRLAGDMRGVALSLGNLGTMAQEAGDLAQARRLYEESLQLRRSLHDPFGTAVMLNNLGELAIHDGNATKAMTLFVHAERMLHDLKSPLAAEPAQALQRLKEQLGAEQYAVLRQAAEQAAWEDVV